MIKKTTKIWADFKDSMPIYKEETVYKIWFIPIYISKKIRMY